MSVDMVETPDRPLRTPLNPGRTLRSSAMPRRRLALLGALWLAAAACASPVGAVRVDPAVAQRQLARSATTTGEPSWPTRNHLAEHGLLEAFDTQPEAAIAELHRAMVASGGTLASCSPWPSSPSSTDRRPRTPPFTWLRPSMRTPSCSPRNPG